METFTVGDFQPELATREGAQQLAFRTDHPDPQEEEAGGQDPQLQAREPLVLRLEGTGVPSQRQNEDLG